jgi:hypothetical protein
VEVLGAFQQIALPVTRNHRGITAPTVHPATVPAIGMHLSHIPTLAVAAASITTGQPVPIVTQVAVILHRTAVNVMTATTQMVAEE